MPGRGDRSEESRHHLPGGFTERELAERVGFEPTWSLRPQRISSPRRYGHFGTSPQDGRWGLRFAVERA